MTDEWVNWVRCGRVRWGVIPRVRPGGLEDGRRRQSLVWWVRWWVIHKEVRMDSEAGIEREARKLLSLVFFFWEPQPYGWEEWEDCWIDRNTGLRLPHSTATFPRFFVLLQ